MLTICCNPQNKTQPDENCCSRAEEKQAHHSKNWLLEHQKWQVKKNKPKTKNLLLQSRDEAELKSNSTELDRSNKNNGPVISYNLQCTENFARWAANSLKCFQFIKRNTSPKVLISTKLNAYISYVVHVITYGFQVWHPSKPDMRNIDIIKHRTTAWIRRTRSDYKNTLIALNILHLSLHIELQDHPIQKLCIRSQNSLNDQNDAANAAITNWNSSWHFSKSPKKTSELLHIELQDLPIQKLRIRRQNCYKTRTMLLMEL